MLREVRQLRLTEERHPNENDVWEAYEYANQKHCIVEMQWFVPHYGLKKWVIEPENDINDLLINLIHKTNV